jgi:hypothetical protein
MGQSVLNIKFAVDNYINSFNIVNLSEKFNQKQNLIEDKYLLTALLGIIEGNIHIDIDNRNWSIPLFNKRFILKNDEYFLLSVVKVMESNNNFYMFLNKYFDMWHSKINKDFFYDSFHQKDLEDNFYNLMNTVEADINKAYENHNLFLGDPLIKLYNSLIDIFCENKYFMTNAN